jgi:hypothetical protein
MVEFTNIVAPGCNVAVLHRSRDHQHAPLFEHVLAIQVHVFEQNTGTRVDSAELHRLLGDSLLAVYSDASSVQDGTGIGVGVVAFDYSQQAREVFSQTLNIGEGQIVYNGELEGIALAFKYAATVALSSQEIRIHADNQAAIYRLRIPSDKPAQVWQLCCIRAANQVIQRDRCKPCRTWPSGKC